LRCPRNAYLQRSRVPAALDGLNSFYTRMEQRYQDTGNYANGANCGVAVPVVANFTVTCTLADAGQSFTANASGSGSMVGYTYRINQQGVRTTVAHPKGLPPGNCWSTKGVACDS
jgi:type IV pilus assembly protein PilE